MAKKKKKNSFDLVSSLMFLVIITIVACISNFSAAAQEPLGSAIVSINIVSTGLFILIWASQAFMAGRARSKGFLITILVWWGGGIALFKLVDIAMSIGSDLLYCIGFYGLLMILCPTYALVPLSMHVLHIDYFTCYPALMVLFLAIYFLGRKQGEKAAQKANELKKFAAKPEDEKSAQPAAEGEIPEAALAAAQAMRAAAEAEKTQAEAPATQDEADPAQN